MIPFVDRTLVSSDGLVYDCLRRTDGGNGVRGPVTIVLAGVRGSGKTELLKEIEIRSRNLPHARFDFEVGGRATARDVLLSLWSQLGARCGQFGRIRFPRLMLGLLVRDNRTTFDDPEQARRAIERLVSSHPLVTGSGSSDGRSPEELGVDLKVDLSSHSQATITISNVQRLLRVPAVRWAMNRARLRVHFADALAWYAEGEDTDAYDALRRLHDEGEREADRTLCEAYLADLVAAYTLDRQARRRTLNCIVLLDNVHRREGAAFLELLSRAAQRTAPPDRVPLVVVATTRQRDRRCVPEETVPRSLAEWRRGPGVPAEERAPLCRIQVRDLTADEIARHVSGDVDDGPRLVRLVHCLTRGHPLSADQLVASVARRRLDGPAALPLRELLDLPALPAGEPRRDGAVTRTMAHRTLRHLLGDVRPASMERLVTWSAAHDVSQMVRMDGLSAAEAVDSQRLRDAISNWTEMDGDRQVVHPLLRRLLLHELGARPPGHERDWDAVHDLLRRDYEERLGDPGTEPRERDELQDRVHYHNLALGNPRPVVRHLRALLVASDVATWLERLRAIAGAPCRPFAGNPLDRVAELVSETFPLHSSADDEVDRVICELLVSRWIASDPVGDPELVLLPVIQHQYQRLADIAVTRLARPAYIALYEEAEEWREEAWEDRCS